MPVLNQRYFHWSCGSSALLFLRAILLTEVAGLPGHDGPPVGYLITKWGDAEWLSYSSQRRAAER